MVQVQIRLHPPESLPLVNLKYVVLGARYRDHWIFVRHRDRRSWELVSGHIEDGESADQAARRELAEEAGAREVTLQVLCDYEVEAGGKTECGRFYAALVKELDAELTFEMEERILSDRLPLHLTYPEVHSRLFQRAKQHFGLS